MGDLLFLTTLLVRSAFISTNVIVFRGHYLQIAQCRLQKHYKIAYQLRPQRVELKNDKVGTVRRNRNTTTEHHTKKPELKTNTVLNKPTTYIFQLSKCKDSRSQNIPQIAIKSFVGSLDTSLGKSATVRYIANSIKATSVNPTFERRPFLSIS